jgi:hypothetical protein
MASIPYPPVPGLGRVKLLAAIFDILRMPSHPWLALPTPQSHGKGMLPILEHRLRIPVACA